MKDFNGRTTPCEFIPETLKELEAVRAAEKSALARKFGPAPEPSALALECLKHKQTWSALWVQ